MSLHEKTDEIRRLIEAFETESAKFHPLTLSLLFITQDGPSFNREFLKKNHAIMLWQYHGSLSGDDAVLKFTENLASSDLKWGIRGAALTCAAIIEGDGLELFVRMAQRAGSLFNNIEAIQLHNRATFEIIENERKRLNLAKPAVTSNNNPLAIWINFLLFHLSMTNPGRESAQNIQPDPFSLSYCFGATIRGATHYQIRSINKVCCQSKFQSGGVVSWREAKFRFVCCRENATFTSRRFNIL